MNVLVTGIHGEPEQRPDPAERGEGLPRSPHYLHYYRRVHRLQYDALRCANVHGPRQDPRGKARVSAVLSNRLRARSAHHLDNGEQARDHVFVGDGVAADLVAADVTVPGLRRVWTRWRSTSPLRSEPA